MRLVIVLAGAMLVGCSEVYPRVCTQIGCGAGLTVLFSTVPVGDVHVEALPEGETTPRTFDCTGSACSPGARFLDFSPDHVVVTVTTDAGSKQFDLRPQYQTSRPNGPRCEPVCRSAQVTVTLP